MAPFVGGSRVVLRASNIAAIPAVEFRARNVVGASCVVGRSSDTADGTYKSAYSPGVRAARSRRRFPVVSAIEFDSFPLTWEMEPIHS